MKILHNHEILQKLNAVLLFMFMAMFNKNFRLALYLEEVINKPLNFCINTAHINSV